MNLYPRNIIILILFTLNAQASGMPVIDTARAMDVARDTMAAGSAVSELMLEFSSNVYRR